MTTENSTSIPKLQRYVFFASAGILVASFCWRAFTPGHEYMLRSDWWLTAILDIGLTFALATSFGKGPNALYAVGLAAGVGLWIIRLHSDASMWSGHWMYWLPSR